MDILYILEVIGYLVVIPLALGMTHLVFLELILKRRQINGEFRYRD